MTSQNLIERALRRIVPAPTREQLKHLRTSLGVHVPTALQRLSERVAGSQEEDVRDILRKEVSETATAGVVDLTDNLTGVNPLMLDFLKTAEIKHSSSPYASAWRPDRTRLELPDPPGFLYHAQEGQKLYFKDTSGNRGTLTGTVTITGNYQLTDVTSVPLRLESWLIEEIVNLAAGVQEEVAA